MTTRFRLPMLVLGTTILIMQAVFMPVSLVYAETTTDMNEQEKVELPPMKNYLEDEQISDPRFFFTRSRMQGTAEEPLQVTFFSDQEVSEARVFLPEEATLLKNQLSTGVSVEKGAQPNEWIVQATRAQHTFVLPLVFGEAGSYEVLVEETTAQLEISEQEAPLEDVVVEETEGSQVVEDEDNKEELSVADEEQATENPSDNQAQETPTEEGKEPVEESLDEDEEDDQSVEVREATVFDGETAEVTTMAEFREAVANPAIGIISVQANLTEATANVLSVDRPLLIQGNGYTLTFGINGFYFQLEDVTQASTIRLENATLTKVGVAPLINATVESSKNWAVELEDITEVNANTMRLASLPEGSIHFTGGVSNFTRTTSAQMFIEAKEVLATNQAEVTISRGNATVFFSSATVSNPKLTVEQGAAVTITTTAGVANTIDLRGENPEVFLQNGELDVATVGTTASPTDTTNNTISLTGTTPKITMNSGARMTVISTLAKRGMHLAGDNAQLLINNSEISVTSATQAAINISGDHSSFSSENSTIQLGSTTGITMNMTGESPQLIFDSSVVNVTSTTGQRINLIGASPLVSLVSTEMIMNASTGRGIYLQGTTPQVKLDNSQLLVTDTSPSQGMILQGTDALLSLSSKSELAITGAGTGALENIQIGNNNARPELSITGESKLSVTTTSGTSGATNTTNNAIHLRGADPKATVSGGSELAISITSNARRGVFLNGDNPELLVTDSQLDVTTVSGGGITIIGDNQIILIEESKTKVDLKSVSGVNLYSSGTLNTFEITNGASVNGSTGDNHSFLFYNRGESVFTVSSDGKLNLSNSGTGLDTAALRFLLHGDYQFNIDGGHINIAKLGGIAPAIRMVGGNNTVIVQNSGQFNVSNRGNGSPVNGGTDGANQGIYYSSGNGNGFTVKDPGSRVAIVADNGPAIDMHSGSGFIKAADLGYFEAMGRTAFAGSGIFNLAGTLEVELNNPLYFDFTNNRPGGGNVFSVNNGSTLHALNSDLAVWRNGVDLTGDPDLNFRSIDYSFSGTNFNTLSGTSHPEQLNTAVFGTSGLTAYSRLSSNNGRWAIADELRVPTNADKKIHGRVSLPVGLDDNRPAWDDEAMVTIEVESPSGETKQEYTAKTVGDSNESPGISIYGEEPRGGLFEIDLDEPLEAGSKVRISKVELTSGELTDGFEHQILTDTVEVFPIIPPKPAHFSSLIIAQDSTTIQGITGNLDAEVTATHNGEPLNIEEVTVEDDGKFTLDLSEVSLEIDDEIQVFLRDAEGSALAAGVVNPPETNNTRGNINPSTELTFHDITFEPATTLIVGDLGPVSPVDPLDPEIEVDPENKPELPEDQGQLSIDFISSFNFGSQAISVHDQTYYAQPQRLLNEDGTVNESEERPNYVQISDRRSENERNGWTLGVTQKEQFKGAENQVLNGASLSLSNQQVITAQGGTAPGLQSVPCTLVPGNRRTLLYAQGSEGTGTWIYRFGDGETAGESVALDVPRGSNPEATTYSSTLIWELSAVPGN